MTISKEVVLKTARLARLRIEENKIEKICEDFSRILELISHLEEVADAKTADLEVTTASLKCVGNAVPEEDQSLNWRRDVVADGNQVEAIVANAPDSAYGMFAVPKVVE